MGKKASKLTKNKVVKTVMGLSPSPLTHAATAALMYAENQESKDEAAQKVADIQSQLDAEKTASAAAKAKADEEAAQQEAVRKKMASLGRLQAGYTFSDSGASTGSTKVFS